STWKDDIKRAAVLAALKLAAKKIYKETVEIAGQLVPNVPTPKQSNGECLTVRILTTHARAWNVLVLPFWVQLGELDHYDTYLKGYWFIDRCWKVWYRGREAIRKVEVDCANVNKQIGTVIEL